MNLIWDELEPLMTWQSAIGLYVINGCVLQIRAELMMFGAPIKEVRLMKRKDNGTNLTLLFHAISLISRTLCLLSMLCLVSTIKARINKHYKNKRYISVSVVSVAVMYVLVGVFFSNPP